MVFVWSYLAAGDRAYTLVQVSINGLIRVSWYPDHGGKFIALISAEVGEPTFPSGG